MKKTLNIGMIGYNFMGKAHSSAWRQAPVFFDLPADIELKTLCGRNAKAVKEAAARYGWKQSETDWRKVVDDPEIDILGVGTPTDSHRDIVLAAAKAGKAILCEKPMAMDAKECREMVAAVKKAKVVHMICHNYRRIPAIVLAKQLIEQGALGDRIYHFQARYAQDWLADPNFPLLWRMDAKVAGLGTLGCIGSHIIDLGRYLVGEFKEVSGILQTFVKERPLPSPSGRGVQRKKGKVTVEDAANWVGTFKNGAMASMAATRFAYGRKNHITLEINGSRGSLAFDFEDMNRLHFYSVDDPPEIRGFRNIMVTEGVHEYANAWWPPGHILGYEHTFTHAFADFVKAVVNGKSVQPTLEDGLANELVMAAIVKSFKSGRREKV